MQGDQHKIYFPAERKQAQSYRYRNRPFHFFWHSIPLLSEIYDGGKRLCIETRAADQRSVNFHLSHQSLDVVGFDAAAVEDSQTGGAFKSKIRRRLLPQEPV